MAKTTDIPKHEVIVIGAGPAALTAAIYTTREDIETLLFERGVIGGLAAVTDKIDNYPGFPDGVEGSSWPMICGTRLSASALSLSSAKSPAIHDEGEYQTPGNYQRRHARPRRVDCHWLRL